MTKVIFKSKPPPVKVVLLVSQNWSISSLTAAYKETDSESYLPQVIKALQVKKIAEFKFIVSSSASVFGQHRKFSTHQIFETFQWANHDISYHQMFTCVTFSLGPVWPYWTLYGTLGNFQSSRQQLFCPY